MPEHLFCNIPPITCVEITAINKMKNIKRTITSTITGIESKIVETNFGMPGTFFINFNGLRILRILIYAILGFFTKIYSHPHPTTKKSRMFQASLR